MQPLNGKLCRKENALTSMCLFDRLLNSAMMDGLGVCDGLGNRGM